jgi:DNA-binding MarR family transcriptional regulator
MSAMDETAAIPLDAETKVAERPADHEAEFRLWLRLLTCATLIEGEIRRRLRAQFGVTLPRFDLMAQLDRAPEGLKMGDLSRRMMVTGANITGIVELLEREGLIERRADPVDRRATWVTLTREGRRAFRKMAVGHERWVIELFEGLSDDDKHELAQNLGKLKMHILATTEPTR